MTFAIPGAAYDTFMGRYSAPLASLFVDFCTIAGDARVQAIRERSFALLGRQAGSFELCGRAAATRGRV